MNTKGLRFYLFFFALVAIFPVLQQCFHFFKVPELSGVFVMSHKPEYSFDALVDGSFQSNADVYIKENTDFRSDFVRLHNQLEYTLFGNINTILMLGKNNYLFDPNYLYAIEGKDALPNSVKIRKKDELTKAKYLLDSLNIPIVFIIAPNKASYYSEYLPIAANNIKTSNQVYFKKLLVDDSIDVIDVDSYFADLKKESKHVLIPKYGAHWSTYGASLAADTLIKCLSKKIKRTIASFNVINVNKTTDAKYNDDDYLASLNLIEKWKSPELSYPELIFTDGYKPNLLIISDSFFWNFYDLGIVDNCFSEQTSFWYYNKSIYDTKRSKIGDRTDSISIKDLKERDAIIMIATAPSMVDFGYRFFEQLNQLKNE